MISLLLLKIAMFSTCNFMKYQLGNYEDKNLPLASVLLFVCFFVFFFPLCLLLTVSSIVGYPIEFILSPDK